MSGGSQVLLYNWLAEWTLSSVSKMICDSSGAGSTGHRVIDGINHPKRDATMSECTDGARKGQSDLQCAAVVFLVVPRVRSFLDPCLCPLNLMANEKSQECWNLRCSLSPLLPGIDPPTRLNTSALF